MNKMFVIFAISLSLLIVVGDTMLMSCALAEATDSNASSIISSGGLSANSVHNSNVIAHIIGNLSNMTSSGGLSANSVHNSNVIAHIIGNLSNMTSSGGLSANSVHNSNVIAHIIGNTAHP